MTLTKAVALPLFTIYVIAGGLLLGGPLFRAYKRPGKGLSGTINLLDLFKSDMFEPEGQRYRWPFIIFELSAIVLFIYLF